LLYFACIFPEQSRLFQRLPFATAWIFGPHVFHLGLMVLQSQGALWGKVAARIASWPVGAALIDYGRIPFELILGFHGILFSMVNLAYIAAALTLLNVSYRRTANPRIRSQVGTISVGLASCAGLYALAVPIPTLLNHPLSPVLRSSLIVAALVFGSGAIAYSMVRFRFLDANLIARKSILYAATSLFLFGVYFAIVRRLDALLETAEGFDPAVFQTAFLLIALVLFQPIFSWLEETLEQYFLRDRGDYRTILRRMSGEVLTVLELDALAERLLATLREGVPARTTVLLIGPGGADPVVRGFGGGVDLGAIGTMPPASLSRLLEGAEILRREEVPALARDRGVAEDVAPLLATVPYLLLPLRYAGGFLGLIALGRKITETRYTAAEISLLQTLANQTSVAITNALLHRDSLAKGILEEELAVARRIQRQFLPSRIPSTPRFGLAAHAAPSKHVGGDYFDMLELGSGSYLVAIADVAGKGVPAALLASMVQAAIRTQAPDRKPLGEMMGRLNRLVHEATPEDRFATCFLAQIEEDRPAVSFSNAGHNYPIHRAAGGACRFLEDGGIPLGIHAEHAYSEGTAVLEPGDALVLYTDGITDAMNRLGEDFGEGRLLGVVERLPERYSADEIVREIVDEVARFTDGTEQMDDITLVALKAR
jgi:sigma-B regulation protein RsbU (phosphoserine phosphatase)